MGRVSVNKISIKLPVERKYNTSRIADVPLNAAALKKVLRSDYNESVFRELEQIIANYKENVATIVIKNRSEIILEAKALSEACAVFMRVFSGSPNQITEGNTIARYLYFDWEDQLRSGKYLSKPNTCSCNMTKLLNRISYLSYLARQFVEERCGESDGSKRKKKDTYRRMFVNMYLANVLARCNVKKSKSPRSRFMRVLNIVFKSIGLKIKDPSNYVELEWEL